MLLEKKKEIQKYYRDKLNRRNLYTTLKVSIVTLPNYRLAFLKDDIGNIFSCKLILKFAEKNIQLITIKQLNPYLKCMFGKANELLLSSSVTNQGDMSQQLVCL